MMTEKGLIYSLGALVGVPEDALRLLIGMLLAYPVSILYINLHTFKCQLSTSLFLFDRNLDSLVDNR